MTKRVGFVKKVVPGGGGTAVVEWGPDFGGVAGDRLAEQHALAMTLLELIGDLPQAHAIQMIELALAGGLDAFQAVALVELALASGVNQAQAVNFIELALDGGVAQGQAVSLPEIGLAANLTQSQALTLIEMALSGGVAHRHAIGQLTFETGDILAPKDVWWPEVALCPDDANKNGTDLLIDGVVATRKDCAFGWDLSGFPTGATCTAATLTVYQKAGPAGGFDEYRVRLIATGSEGWSEATASCNDNPVIEVGANDTIISFGAGVTGDNGTDFLGANPSVFSRIDDRMGVGFFSLGMQGSAVTDTQLTLQSADSAGSPGNASGPRLRFTFTTP